MVLIISVSLAVLLGVVVYFALFSGPQLVQPMQTAQNAPPQVFPTSTAAIATSSMAASSSATSSAFANDGGSATNPNASSSAGSFSQSVYQTMFSQPYPITWSEGQPQLSVMGGTLQANQLILSINIQLGSSSQCVPINLRLITDEQGDMVSPTAPAMANFPLAADGTCQGEAGTAYNESVTFTVDPLNAPFLFSTGDPANGFFEISTTTDNGIKIDVPQKSG